MRIRIERAIYQNSENKEYYVLSYNKTTKNTQVLFRDKSLKNVREYRDNNLRYAKYGKGIQKRKNSYIAQLLCQQPSGNIHTIYIGTFKTAKEAVSARKDYILKLL